MALFRRSKKTSSTIPPEVEEYYQAERRGRKHLAWLMTVVALLVTIAIVIGLFLVGQWLYRTVRHTEPPTSSSTTSSNESGEHSSDTNKKDATDNSQSQTEQSDTSQSSDRQSSSNNSHQPQSTEAPSSDNNDDSNTTHSSSNGQSDQTQSQSQGEDALVNTGPGDSAVVAFVVVAVLGYIGYRLKLTTAPSRD